MTRAEEAPAEKGPAEQPAHGRAAALTVRAWFLLALLVTVLVLAVGGAVTAVYVSRAATAEDRLLESIGPARTDVFRFQAAMLDQETGLRGHLLTGLPESLEPYERGSAAEERLRASLAAQLVELPESAALLDTALLAADSWRLDHAEPVLNGDLTGELGPGSKAAFDQVREALDALQTELSEERDQARQDLSAANAARDRVMIAVLGAFPLTALGLAVLLHYTVGRPLARLGAASREVAGGDFGRRITPHGPSDLRALAEDVEGMRGRIVDELTTARQQREELRRRGQEMDQQADELLRSNTDLEQFAYVASHDLQEPLRKVASFCQLLERRYRDQLDERGTQYIDFAVDGAKRMQVLIDDLLTYSRVGREADLEQATGLDEALDRALGNLAAALDDTGAVVRRPERLPVIAGDPTLMAMLFQNLVGNAVKFRHPERPPEVAVEAAWLHGDGSGPGRWECSVTDNGIGVQPEFAEKVFVIFQRLHNRDAYGGTGIGLSLCKKIVEHCGGTIRIDTGAGSADDGAAGGAGAGSGPREGTRVVFTLPGAGPDRDGPSASAPDGAPEPDTPAPEPATDADPAAAGTDHPAPDGPSASSASSRATVPTTRRPPHDAAEQPPRIS